MLLTANAAPGFVEEALSDEEPDGQTEDGVAVTDTTGDGFTVTTFVTAQAAAGVNVTVEVPADTPLTMPVEMPTVATLVLLLDHVPDPAASESVVVFPLQTEAVPLIAAVWHGVHVKVWPLAG
jgi:hypothetical protein